VGVVKAGHPLGRGKVTAARFAKGDHVVVSRKGEGLGPIDEALGALGLKRRIVTSVGSFATALALARETDLIASVPERHTGILRDGMHAFPLPVPTPEFTLSLLWHPRLDADPVHRWLRDCIRGICAGKPANR
jgi:DNA-binding transcriptional LysR family regulator